MKKAGRNNPCPCGSGKKFKKCCESQLSRKEMKAHLIDLKSEEFLQKTRTLNSLFQARLHDPSNKTQEADSSHLLSSPNAQD
jgi:hypothetical protein